MLDLHDQEARKPGRDPLLIELVRLFLLDAVVARDVKALAVVGLEIRIGRLGAEAVEVRMEMIVEEQQRIVRLGMLIESLRHQHSRRQVHRPAPELGQQLALDLDVPDVLGVLRRRDRRDLLVEHNLDGPPQFPSVIFRGLL